jgi:hypothetical protein
VDADKKGRRLLVFERKVLRTIYGPNIVDGVYKSRYNFELVRKFNSPRAIHSSKMAGVSNPLCPFYPWTTYCGKPKKLRIRE